MDEVVVAKFADGTEFGIQLIDIGVPMPAASTERPASGTDADWPTGDTRLTTPTGIRERAHAGVASLGTLLAHIAAEIGAEIAAVDPASRPSEVEAEVCLGMSAQAGPVWLSAAGECTLRAKLTWRY